MPIFEKEVFDRAREVLSKRNHRSRVLRSPNVLAGLARCGKCGAPMHVTYPRVEPKCMFKYYVQCNRAKLSELEGRKQEFQGQLQRLGEEMDEALAVAPRERLDPRCGAVHQRRT
jgi:hypothetical protein